VGGAPSLMQERPRGAMSAAQLSHVLKLAALHAPKRTQDRRQPRSVMIKGNLSKIPAASRRPTAAKRFGRKAVGFAAMLSLASVAGYGSAMAAGGSDTVQTLYANLLGAMKNGSTLGESGRFAQLEPVIRRSFDLPVMARLSVGPAWAGLGAARQQQVTDSYGRYISAIYADRFDSYDGQKLQVTGERPAPSGVIVSSRIVKANGEPVEIDYLMRQDGGSWQIADIYVDGTISEVATRRSEFAAILRNQGIDGLIEALNRKADMLTRTTARAD
jgi:phospholipid transport system substrate-binding protein